ncbi:MAG: type II secretion system protein N [Pseudomonadota bacterium]
MIGKVRSWSSAAREAAATLAQRPDRARLFVEGLLVCLIAVQVVVLVWRLAMPAAEAAAPPAPRADLSVLSRFDAFFRTGEASSLAEVTAAGSEQFRLFGVRAGGPGGGSAIIGLPDGRQVSVGVGDEIEPGLTLTEVGPDHAVVSRNGSPSRITFGEVPVGAAAPPPPPTTEQVVTPQSSAAATVDPQALMAEASLRPRMRGLAVTGFTVNASGQTPALAAAGLQPGDVITSIDGVPLDGLGRLNELRTRLSRAPQAEIRFERNGQPRTTTIRTGR